MGIFADFLASRPATTVLERRARLELQRLADAGDPDAPAGFAGRTGYAILKVLGLTDLDAPPTSGTGIGFRTPSVDEATKRISDETIAVICNQIGIDESSKSVETDLLFHCNVQTTVPIEQFTQPAVIPLSGLVDDYNIASLSLGDGADVTIWNSDVGTDILTVYNNSTPFNPTFEAAAFNGQGGVRMDQNREADNFSIVGLQSNNTFQPFAGRTGTFAAVFEPRVGSALGGFMMYPSGSAKFYVATATHTNRPFVQGVDGFTSMEEPDADLPLSTPQLFLWWRDDDRLEFRRNGVARTGATLGTNPAPPVAADVVWCGLTSEGNSIDCAIARIMRWDRVLTAQEQLDVESILTGLYL